MRKIGIIIYLFLTGCAIIHKKEEAHTVLDNYYNTSIDSIAENNLSSINFTLEKIEIIIEEGDSRQKIIGFIRYTKPGILLASLRNNTGIEGMRIYIDKDTILANDRINKKVYHGSSDHLSQKYGIKINYLPILIGDLIHDSNREEQKEVRCGNGIAEIVTATERSKLKYITDCKKKKVISTELSREEGSDQSKINMIFRNFKQLGNVFYPQYISITDLIADTRINIEIKRAEIYVGPELKFIPGNNYEEVVLK